jgi:Na+/melibiose symporter-like transporter
MENVNEQDIKAPAEENAMSINIINQEADIQAWWGQYGIVVVLFIIFILIGILLLVIDHRSNKKKGKRGITINLDFLPFELHAPRTWLFFAICGSILGIITVVVLDVTKYFGTDWMQPTHIASLIIDLAYLGTFIMCLVIYIKAEIDDKHVHKCVTLTAWCTFAFGIAVLIEVISSIPHIEFHIFLSCILAIISGEDYSHLVYLLRRVGPVEYRTDDQLLSDYYVKKFLKIVKRHTDEIDMAKLLGMADVEGVRDILARLMTLIQN